MDDHAAAGIDLDVLGTLVRVHTATGAAHSMLAAQWSRCLTTPDRHPGSDPVVVSAGDMVDGDLPDGFGYLLASQVTLRAIERAVGRRLMFHAAGLATEDGQVIALVAPSGTGKTTAALTLCRDAFGYVTDETVSVDPDGQYSVLPYPKPLSVVRPGAPGISKSQHGPDELGLRPVDEPLRLARIVLLDRRREPTPPTLAPVGLLDGVVEVAHQVSALARLPEPLQVLCRTVDHCHGIHRLSYDDIGTTAEVLAGLLASPPAHEAGQWHVWDPPGRPGHWTDAVQVGEDALVLLDTVPVRLGPLGRTAVEVLLAGGEEADVLAATLETYGPHPEASVLVAEAVAAVREAGLLSGD